MVAVESPARYRETAAGIQKRNGLSRLRHQCHTVPIDGPSLREPQG